ncbi:hypothetical protein [Escherichia phage vB_EcoM-UFV05]|nr:hypothetical protein [Escherichia phage vB_EcoM-UFV09]UYE93149.1 hypothetical protein [Escherichia phage vB_EcoM-UFV05]UYL84042.1 hypothetical protein [Escherichia phage vB_EcoM-UFV06]UYL84328.1 hypothetical protein [Escherichia phage vB_EcoM-UFV10]UYL84614.1 hypothetical protein [Escherichia phage vB_EcoM-UFV11]
MSYTLDFFNSACGRSVIECSRSRFVYRRTVNVPLIRSRCT